MLWISIKNIFQHRANLYHEIVSHCYFSVLWCFQCCANRIQSAHNICFKSQNLYRKYISIYSDICSLNVVQISQCSLANLYAKSVLNVLSQSSSYKQFSLFVSKMLISDVKPIPNVQRMFCSKSVTKRLSMFSRKIIKSCA